MNSAWMAAAPSRKAVRSRLITAYRAELSAIDQELGRLFDYLQREGRWRSTLVIVMADHGQLLGERGNIGHAYTLEEELLRVPLIIKAPASLRLRTGVYQHPIQTDDLFALCQTLGGLTNREGAQIASAIRADVPFRQLTF
jgi:arylsulfatase A-like enzyme